jgi:hypothetical protein
MLVPQLPNDRWSIDFVAEQFIDGRRGRSQSRLVLHRTRQASAECLRRAIHYPLAWRVAQRDFRSLRHTRAVLEAWLPITTPIGPPRGLGGRARPSTLRTGGPLRFAPPTTPIRGPPSSPPNSVMQIARLQSPLDKTWGNVRQSGAPRLGSLQTPEKRWRIGESTITKNARMRQSAKSRR